MERKAIKSMVKNRDEHIWNVLETLCTYLRGVGNSVTLQQLVTCPKTVFAEVTFSAKK